MSRSDWGQLAKVGLVGLAILVAIALGSYVVGDGLSRDAIYERQADEHSREYAADSNNQIRQRCLALGGAAKAECVQEERHKYRSDRRDELDLVAQRKSANWAFVMGGAAVLGMVLSAIGVVLVWITFRATRRAADSAGNTYDAFVAVERARLKISVQQILPYAGNHIGVRLDATNIGKAPCVVISFASSWQKTNRFDEIGGYLATDRHKLIAGSETKEVGEAIRKGEAEGDFVRGVVRYTSPFGDHVSHFCFQVLRLRSDMRNYTSRETKGTDWPFDT
jgi:hypothetical protein